VVAGVDAGAHENDSRYFKVTGPQLLNESNLPPVDRSGNASRTFLGAYSQATLNPISLVTVTAGVRADVLWNSFTPDQPAVVDAQSVTHSAISPKLGVNFDLVDSKRATVNAYLAAGTSFKAPALDQQYGLRTITVAFGPDVFDVSTSNGDLAPQRGSQLESGVYGAYQGNLGRTELSLSVYRLDMRDELDIDLATFQLVNIGRSRHDGAEIGLNFNSPTGFAAFGNYTLQSTTFRNGDYSGNFVKAIPRDLYSFGTSFAFRNGLAVGAVGHGRRRTFVDDPNTVSLDDYLALDAQGSFSTSGFRLSLSVLNVLDQEYSTTAYPDPSGGDALFLYPAAGTSVKIGGTFSW
jgi:outer membrane cobalamin receptor